MWLAVSSRMLLFSEGHGMKSLRKANAIFDGTIDILALFAVLLLAFTALSVSAEIVMRYFVGRPLLWVIEVAEYCLVWATFLGTTWVLKREGHVIMDIVLTRLNPRTQTLVNLITSVIGIAICLILTWYGVKVTLDLYQRGHYLSSVLMPPSFILFAIIPIGLFLLFIQFLRRAYGYLQSWQALRDKE